MLRMGLKRLLMAVPSLVGVVIVTFLLTRALPGDVLREALRDEEQRRLVSRPDRPYSGRAAARMKETRHVVTKSPGRRTN